MRIRFSGIIPITAAGIMVALAVPSSAQRTNEISLLGIKVWNRYSDVMQKFGPPSRIEVGMASGNSGGGGQLGAMGSSSMGMGGSSMGMGGGRSGPTSMAPAGMGGSSMGMMGGGKMSMPGLGGMGMGGGGGSSMGMAMGSRGSQGPAGMGMADGGPGMGGSMGGGMSLGGDTGGTSGEDGEVTWVYERGPVTNYFLFNKDGRVIQIQSFGYSGPAVTSRGIRQGDSVSKVYGSYGWTSLITKDVASNTMTLDYSKERNAYFQLADRKNGKGYRVVGITIGIVDKAQIKSLGTGTAMGGDSMGGMPGMGMPGMGSPGMGSNGMGARMGGGPARGGRGKMGGGAAGAF